MNMSSFIGFILCLTCINCDGQEATKSDTPFFITMPDFLSTVDTSPSYHRSDQKIILTGTVYHHDLSPASDVILYYYQTDHSGRYPYDESYERNMPKTAQGHSHGYIRGWVKTDTLGRYSIYTSLPGSYPSGDEVAHIHLTIKDNVLDAPYYIDNFVFDHDPKLTSEERLKLEDRGGSGIIRFVEKDGHLIGERNIYLGLNVPEYPTQSINKEDSGRKVGENIYSFTPYHAYGDDAGTKTCPICKYGWFHGILFFVGNDPQWEDVKNWLRFLEKESLKREETLKVYFVYGNEANYSENWRKEELNNLGKELALKKVALTFVPSFSDEESDIHLNKISPSASNTMIIYKRSNIVKKFIDLKPTAENFSKISKQLDLAENKYFHLKRARIK